VTVAAELGREYCRGGDPGEQHVHDFEIIQPTVPDMVPIEALHRDGDGYISFARERATATGPEWEELFAIQARDLRNVFPSIVGELCQDSYFSVNSMFRHGGRGWGMKDLGLFRGFRNRFSLRHLTAVFADLDCHKLGISPGQAVGAVIDGAIARRFPKPSMFLYSGRGVWCFWTLQTDEGELVRAFPETVQFWAQCQHAITGVLSQLGADAAARDSARVTRVPGSLSSKAAAHVGYYLGVDGDGKRLTYTLEELAECLGVKRRKAAARVAAKSQELVARGAKGAAARWRYDLNRFRLLWALRGSFSVGMRSKALNVWCQILASLSGVDALDRETIIDEARQLWETFPQPDGEPYTWAAALRVIDSAISARRQRRPIRHDTISGLLEITPEESRVCGWPPATAAGVPQLDRNAAKQRRRELLREWCSGPSVPALRDLAERMEREAGLKATAATIRTDLEAIGLANPRSKTVRAKRRSARTQSQRKLF
jgi:hypothetical protein